MRPLSSFQANITQSLRPSIDRRPPHPSEPVIQVGLNLPSDSYSIRVRIFRRAWPCSSQAFCSQPNPIPRRSATRRFSEEGSSRTRPARLLGCARVTAGVVGAGSTCASRRGYNTAWQGSRGWRGGGAGAGGCSYGSGSLHHAAVVCTGRADSHCASSSRGASRVPSLGASPRWSCTSTSRASCESYWGTTPRSTARRLRSVRRRGGQACSPASQGALLRQAAPTTPWLFFVCVACS
jgi:hypothetical protein